MRVLMVSSNYAPEPCGIAVYSAGVAEGLVERGHEVTVVSGFPHYPAWRAEGRQSFRHERVNGVAVRRSFHYVPKTPSLRRRALYEAGLVPSHLAALPGRRPDVVLGVVPSLAGGVVARSAAALYRRPYGLVFQDLVAPAAAQAGARGVRGPARLLASVEGGLARGASAVGIVAGGYDRYLRRSGVRPEAVVRVFNWAEYAQPSAPRDTTRRRFGWREDELVCLYAGSMGYKQGLDVLVEAAGHVGDRVRIVFAGDGSERRSLEALGRWAEAPVSFLPSCPKGEYESLLEAADVLVVTQRAEISDMCIASKLGPYMMAGRPVLASVGAGSETARELEQAGAGVIVRPGDPRLLAAALVGLRDDPSLCAALGRAGRAHATSRLTRAAALDGYEHLLARIRARSAPRPVCVNVPVSEVEA